MKTKKTSDALKHNSFLAVQAFFQYLLSILQYSKMD